MLRSIFKWFIPIWFAFCALLELFVFITHLRQWWSFVFMLFALWFVFLLWSFFENNKKN